MYQYKDDENSKDRQITNDMTHDMTHDMTKETIDNHHLDKDIVSNSTRNEITSVDFRKRLADKKKGKEKEKK